MRTMIERAQEQERRQAAFATLAVNRGAEPLVTGKSDRINKYLRSLENGQ